MMRKWMGIAGILLALGMMEVQAQDMQRNRGQGQQGHRQPPSIEQRVTKATQKLNLSEQQAAQWTAIFNKYEAQIQAAHQNRDRAAADQLRQSIDGELRSTLNSEQEARFNQMMAKRQERRQNGNQNRP